MLFCWIMSPEEKKGSRHDLRLLKLRAASELSLGPLRPSILINENALGQLPALAHDDQ